jgi:hypothetical protein
MTARARRLFKGWQVERKKGATNMDTEDFTPAELADEILTEHERELFDDELEGL